MEAMDLILWAVLETTKMFLVVHGILGFTVNKSKWKYIAFLYLLVGIPVCLCTEIENVYFELGWGILFVELFFDGKKSRKLQCYFLVSTVIAVADLFLWSACVAVFGMNAEVYLGLTDVLSDTAGLVVWLLISVALAKKREKIYRIFIQLQVQYVLLIIVLVFGLGMMGACVQYSLTEGAPESMRKFLMFVEMIVTLLSVVGCGIFAYTLYSKKHIEMQNELNEERLEFQKSHYEALIKKDEGIRQFRHDIRKHMGAMKALCENDRMEEVKQYITELSTAYQENETVYTGNIVSDYFINTTIDELSREVDLELDYCISGKIPEHTKVSDNDLCILLANALENAQHAIKRKKGKCKLLVDFKNYQERLYISIENSALPDEMAHLDKGKREGHGYGTLNMKQVVEKYEGELEFSYEDGMFKVNIKMNG